MKKTIKQYLQERVEKGAKYTAYGTNSEAQSFYYTPDVVTLFYDMKTDENNTRRQTHGVSIYDILYSPESNFWDVAFGNREWLTRYVSPLEHKIKSVSYTLWPIAYLESIERPE